MRVQRPQEKINHALVLGVLQGVGKDTLLEPVKHAVGPWNFTEVSPQQRLGRFNGFVKSVVLRVSEAKDVGEFDRFKFYAHTKVYLAGRRTCSDSGDGANQRAIRRTKPKKHETRLEGGPLSRRTGEHQ